MANPDPDHDIHAAALAELNTMMTEFVASGATPKQIEDVVREITRCLLAMIPPGQVLFALENLERIQAASGVRLDLGETLN